jgi:NAD(P)-dependent dehydrogenase (short-subunit alcohol dehydrogenase family)
MTQGDSGFTNALEKSIAIAPMNRRGVPQEIADACLFLCSSKASFVQGHAMVNPLLPIFFFFFFFWKFVPIVIR